MVILFGSAVTWIDYTFSQESVTRQDDVTLYTRSAGIRRYESDAWGVIGVEGVNNQERDINALVAVYFDDRPFLQFARKLWIPAKSRRASWIQVKLPPSTDRAKERISYSTMVLEEGADGEQLQREEYKRLVRSNIATLDNGAIKTAFIFPNDAYQRLVHRNENTSGGRYEGMSDDAYKTALLSRQVARLPKVTIEFTDPNLPPTAQSLESLDQIVIGADHILDDTAGLAAIKAWLQQGGRIWIMLDLVSPELVAALLGGATCCTEVDRVELNEFTIEDVLQPHLVDELEQWQSDEPVEFLRVLTDATKVHCKIDGWPAAFWHPVGDGEVLITTLGARGWLRDKEHTRPDGTPALVALTSIVSRLYQPRHETTLDQEMTKPVLQEQIGYRIPDRGVAASLLALNCGGLLIASIWLARRRRLEHMAWVVPAITGASAAILLFVGSTNTKSVESQAATITLVKVAYESTEAQVAGIGAVYSQQSTDLSLGTKSNGFVMPEFNDATVATNRLLWDDDGRARWENLAISQGVVRFIEFENTTRLPAPFSVRGQFGPGGFEGRLVADSKGRFSDLVIASPPSPNLAVSIDSQGAFKSGISDVLPPNQFMPTTMMTDEQRRRQAVYRHLLTPSIDRIFPARPALFAWSHTEEVGFQLPDSFSRSDAAVSSIPIAIGPTPPKTQIQIPATFIRVEVIQGEHGKSSMFNERTGRWMEAVSSATNTQLRFVLPRSVLPCALNRALLSVKMIAPSRTLTVSYPKGDEFVVLNSVNNPSGVVTIEIDDPDALYLDNGGGLRLGIDISATEQQLAAAAASPRPVVAVTSDSVAGRGDPDAVNRPTFDSTTWQIDYLRLDAFGETN